MNRHIFKTKPLVYCLISLLLLTQFLFQAGTPVKAYSGEIEGVASVFKRFIDPSGREIIGVIAPGKPPQVKASAAFVPQVQDAGALNSLSGVPAYNWSYGCSPTSAAMLFAYYDRNVFPAMYTGPTNGGVMPLNNSVWGPGIGGSDGQCPVSATRLNLDGRTVRGHVDDYWISYGSSGPDPFVTNSWTEHGLDSAADFMGTSQWRYLNTDGATSFYFYNNGDPLNNYTDCEPGDRDGARGMRLFAEARGYTVIANFNQLIQGRGSNPSLGFTFTDFMAEIDAGRPVLIQVTNHSMLGYGYNTTGNIIYIHDTWDYSDHQMTWGGSYSGLQHYGVTVFRLGGDGTPPSVSTVAAIGITDHSATLNGNLSILGSGSNVYVSFQWGTSPGIYTNETAAQLMNATGAFSTPVSSFNPGTTYYFRSRAMGIGTTYGAELSFTTLPPTGPLTLTSPNGGESWAPGSNHNITWSYNTGIISSSSLCRLELYKGGLLNSYITFNHAVGSGGSGSYSWTIPSGQANGSDYKVKIVVFGKAVYSDESDGVFGIASGPPPVVPPTLVTSAATSVEETTATLNGNITNTGGANADTRGFVWGTVSRTDPGNVAPGSSGYTSNWSESGSYSTGVFSTGITSLVQGTKYYCRAFAHNSAGYAYGPEMDFLTKPEAPTGASASAVSSSQINLSWTKGTGALNTVVVRKTGSYPNDRTDGTTVYSGTAATYNDTGLAGSTHYYYRFWSHSVGSDQYSDSYAQADANTQAAPPPTGPLTLTSPNGGESWAPGSNHNITWSYNTGIISSSSLCRLELYKGGLLNSYITFNHAVGSGGSGSYSWTIPSGQANGSDYKVKIVVFGKAAYSDESDGAFGVSP